MSPELSTKARLREAMRNEHDALVALISPLSDGLLSEPALGDHRSVKDTLAHISAWEGRCARWLEAVARGETPARPEVRDVDGANERDYLASKDAQLARVRAAFDESHAAMLRAVEALSEDALLDETRFGWPTWRMASSNSDEHYAEHAAEIAAWLKDRGA